MSIVNSFGLEASRQLIGCHYTPKKVKCRMANDNVALGGQAWLGIIFIMTFRTTEASHLVQSEAEANRFYMYSSVKLT
ncbi:hypothetical protein N7471_006412 [Penicillium samsonianum]|uniref:uncharacterized protein n=1 Tax=Penicillium samsonianum TaxID=1882272 RepID=UPI00254948C5|nr:uncharacterized protein N7471_006412 [Penicillium samsonianum]KAJ6139926.1 hypothetical protein N7471_006412 [Penicillium samsonianum]